MSHMRLQVFQIRLWLKLAKAFIIQAEEGFQSQLPRTAIFLLDSLHQPIQFYHLVFFVSVKKIITGFHPVNTEFESLVHEEHYINL